MKKTMLTYETLTQFETLVNPETLTNDQTEKAEHYAYCANMVASNNPDITAWAWFCHLVKEFMGIDLEALEAAQKAAAALDQVAAELEARKDRSAWNKGVTVYALELVEELEERAAYEGRNPEPGAECREWMLNGAQDWSQYSWGGSALIYDGDIAERLCCPSELKKTRNGKRRPNREEEWLDVQARALYQACNRVARLYRSIVTA